MKVGRMFEIVRGGQNVLTGDRLSIILAKGRAFGSGDHETTKSCLEEMEKMVFKPANRVLDLGCGTGVLSVAAARLGAGWVTAVDPQVNAVNAAKETVELNGLQDRVEVLEGDLFCVADRGFDIVLANLYGDILDSLAGTLLACVNPGGWVLLSGILYQDNYQIKSHLLDKGFEILNNRFMEEYTTLLARKI